MKKSKIILLVGLSIFCMLGWMGYLSIQSLKEKSRQKELSNSLTGMFSNLEIDADITAENTLLMYFNSECEHCRWEIKQLSENIDYFSKVNIALVSHEPSDSAYRFLEKYSLHQYFINARPEHVMSSFSGGVPQIFIYEGDRLKEKFRGEVKLEVLMEAVKN